MLVPSISLKEAPTSIETTSIEPTMPIMAAAIANGLTSGDMTCSSSALMTRHSGARLQPRQPRCNFLVAMKRAEFVDVARIRDARRHAGGPRHRLARTQGLGCSGRAAVLAGRRRALLARGRLALFEVGAALEGVLERRQHRTQRGDALLDLLVVLVDGAGEHLELRLEIHLPRDAGTGEVVAVIRDRPFDLGGEIGHLAL